MNDTRKSPPSRPPQPAAGPAALDAWLGAARDELAGREPPPWLQSQVAAALDGRLAARQALAARAVAPPAEPRTAPRRWLRWWLAAPALAAVLLAWIVGPVLLAPTSAAALPRFVALVPLERIAAEPRPLVMSGQLPRTALADYGLPVDPARADVPVAAEFVMSPQGLLLALRIVE